MNSDLPKHMLTETPETSAKAGPELHQNIMRAVRLAKSDGKIRQVKWAVPAWAAGAAVLTFAFILITQTVPEDPVHSATEPATMVRAHSNSSPVSLVKLGDKLAALSEQSLLPEKELKEELERLKSDLKRFGFRS